MKKNLRLQTSLQVMTQKTNESGGPSQIFFITYDFYTSLTIQKDSIIGIYLQNDLNRGVINSIIL